MAYLSGRDYYTRMEEVAAEKGIADIIFYPKKERGKPDIIVELKWEQTEKKALDQIRERNYQLGLKEYHGKVMLVGINYSKKTKEHTCKIEEAYV